LIQSRPQSTNKEKTSFSRSNGDSLVTKKEKRKKGMERWVLER